MQLRQQKEISLSKLNVIMIECNVSQQIRRRPIHQSKY